MTVTAAEFSGDFSDDFSAAFFADHLAVSRVMVILRGLDPEETVRLCGLAKLCGAGLLEVPVQSPAALAAFEAAHAWGAGAGLPVGAGTITSPRLHRQVVAAGAAFTVAPGLDGDVVAEARAAGVPHLPGVATPSEVQQATKAGFTWLKAFPASTLGSHWFGAVLGPFPQVRLVATGGVDTQNARAFLGAGASAVALGSSFAGAAPALVETLRATDGPE